MQSPGASLAKQKEWGLGVSPYSPLLGGEASLGRSANG
jgi:hypothetical protein